MEILEMKLACTLLCIIHGNIVSINYLYEHITCNFILILRLQLIKKVALSTWKQLRSLISWQILSILQSFLTFLRGQNSVCQMKIIYYFRFCSILLVNGCFIDYESGFFFNFGGQPSLTGYWKHIVLGYVLIICLLNEAMIELSFQVN